MWQQDKEDLARQWGIVSIEAPFFMVRIQPLFYSNVPKILHIRPSNYQYTTFGCDSGKKMADLRCEWSENIKDAKTEREC